MAALNLTTERAPTKPKDNANENFTTVITIVVVIANKTKTSEKLSLLFIDWANFLYVNLIMIEQTVDTNKDSNKTDESILISKFCKSFNVKLFMI